MKKAKVKFSEYYKMYLAAHKNPCTKLLHFGGQILTALYIYFIIYLSIKHDWLLLGYLWFTPNIVYLLAWPSHWWIEKNEPLAYTNKWYAKWSDFKMFWEVLTLKVPLDTRD